MVLNKLGSSLRESLKKIVRAGYIDKKTLEEVIKDMQRALLASDVNVKLVFELTENIKKRAWGEEVKAGLSQREHVVNIVYEELTKTLTGKSAPLSLQKKTKIMLIGLFGSGKTTTCAKLAKYLTKKGLKVGMISTDIWRPAAYEQLKQLGESINVPVFGGGKDPVKILKEQLEKAKKEFDVVILDSAGRDALDEELATELKEIDRIFQANEKILVIPADLGQKASEQASAFNEMVGVTGVILTKMEATAKGGGALSACSAVDVPIKFVGIGESVEDFEEFDSAKFVSKLLGMGDIESLLKKAQEVFGEDVEEDQVKAMMKGRFTLKDLYKQIKSMKKMGPLSKIFEMLPMGADIPQDQMQLSQERMDDFLTIMDSFTPYELENPDELNSGRVKRIASGSGKGVDDVRGLVKHYNMSKKMMKRFGKNKRSMNQLMKVVRAQL